MKRIALLRNSKDEFIQLRLEVTADELPPEVRRQLAIAELPPGIKKKLDDLVKADLDPKAKDLKLPKSSFSKLSASLSGDARDNAELQKSLESSLPSLIQSKREALLEKFLSDEKATLPSGFFLLDGTPADSKDVAQYISEE